MILLHKKPTHFARTICNSMCDNQHAFSGVWLGYGRRGTCHGRRFDEGAKIAAQKLKYLFTLS